MRPSYKDYIPTVLLAGFPEAEYYPLASLSTLDSLVVACGETFWLKLNLGEIIHVPLGCNHSCQITLNSEVSLIYFGALHFIYIGDFAYSLARPIERWVGCPRIGIKDGVVWIDTQTMWLRIQWDGATVQSVQIGRRSV